MWAGALLGQAPARRSLESSTKISSSGTPAHFPVRALINLYIICPVYPEEGPMKKFVKVPGIFFVALALSATLFAQLDTGTITVSVRDPSDTVVAGASVVLRNENTGIDVRSGITNEQGIFNAVLIPSGNYSIHVELKGFKSYQRPDVSLQVNHQISVPVVLQVGDVTEQITVNSAAPLVEI